MDSISADLMSRAGASDAASALRLVAGASVQDGKFAVIRGLPDRYISSLLNGVRLPTSDEDKRAVELDQFPSSVIESIRVTKTFTPDQQGVIGPAVAGASRELLEAKVLRGAYPPGYAPKRNTKTMPPLPHLRDHIGDLAAYLQAAAAPAGESS